jgi:FKBP-type peptidyl-prolyl cis-trans isomerase FkpA
VSRYRSLFAVLLAVFVVACGDSATTPDLGGSDPAVQVYAASLGVNLSAMTKLSKALYIQDVVAGTGATAANGHFIAVTYTGWLANGTQFESNVGKDSLRFPLGAGAVIAGWDQGLVGMRVGGKRRLVIGSALAYGTQGFGAIPSNSTLVFDVQLLTVQ